MSVIQEKLKLLPDSPGVYIMLDAEGIVIYVGKAKVLKNRVRQYFHSSPKQEKVMAMVANIADFYYIITKTEIDALALENNLIKKYKPKYNILLKDDKTYPYIKVYTKEEFPHFVITRKISKDGKYFGPFMGGISCKDLLEIVSMAYNVRTCQTSITREPKKPCLAYHIHRCPAPCARLIEPEVYALNVKRAMEFLGGDYREVEELLQEKMAFYAEHEEFELAMSCRDKLAMLSKLKLKRITSINRDINADIISYRTNGLYSAVNVLLVRSGIMQGGMNYALEDAVMNEEDALSAFLLQYYAHHEAPEEIITESYCETDLLKCFFEGQKKSIDITVPSQGVKKQLLDMARKNAEDYLTKAIEKIKHKDDMTQNACRHLQELLRLKRYPKRMECYDISNISGVDKVGSMVVFTDGEADKTEYRRFRIKTVEGANDFASLQEVLERRLSKLGTEEQERFMKPDLIVIDGGKGQLSAVKEIFDEMGIDDIDLISLAKQEEEVFVTFQDQPVIIERRDYALRLLQRIRDESHRFAITYFRTLHSKRNLESVLSEIEGVGKKKRMALMAHFGTLDRIKRATVDELKEVEGIGDALANVIQQHFKEREE
ncbi:MAG: excinuclease ABC subunit UvrC [Clostridia bacterium]|nr:excinuclease ABC subunit UvrC [Clostridia bacterium]